MRLLRSFWVGSILALGFLVPMSLFAHAGEEEAAAPTSASGLHVPTQIGAEVPAMTQDPTFGLPRNMVFSAVQPVVKQEDERANIRYMLLIAAIGLLVAAHLPKYVEPSDSSASSPEDHDHPRASAI